MNFSDALLLVAIATASPPATATGDIITGRAIVIDGDTIIINRTHIRLFGMDAPEIEQSCTDKEGLKFKCGMRAADVLTEEIGGADVSCFRVDTDRYGRMVGVCTARGNDLGKRMVERGYAVDYPFFSGGRYHAAEEEAVAAKRGVWGGAFQNPREWRKEHRR